MMPRHTLPQQFAVLYLHSLAMWTMHFQDIRFDSIFVSLRFLPNSPLFRFGPLLFSSLSHFLGNTLLFFQPLDLLGQLSHITQILVFLFANALVQFILNSSVSKLMRCTSIIF
jgi:hypothetical protein